MAITSDMILSPQEGIDDDKPNFHLLMQDMLPLDAKPKI